MIRGNGQEEDNECGQGQVPGAVPAGPEERHGRQESGHEDARAPFGEPGAGSGSALKQTLEPGDQSFELVRSRDRPHSRPTILEGWKTVNDF